MGRIRLPALAPGQAARRYMRLGEWYGAEGANTTIAPANNQLCAEPLEVPETYPFDQIGVEVTVIGNAGSQIRLGVYYDDGNGAPSALLLDAGTVPGDGSTGVKSINIGVTLMRGRWWLAAVSQNSATTQPTLRAINSPNPTVGASSPSQAASVAYAHNIGVSGALPSTFTPITFTTAFTRPMIRRA